MRFVSTCRDVSSSETLGKLDHLTYLRFTFSIGSTRIVFILVFEPRFSKNHAVYDRDLDGKVFGERGSREMIKNGSEERSNTHFKSPIIPFHYKRKA